MKYQEAHDLVATLYYIGRQLSKTAFDNLHSLMSMIPDSMPHREELFEVLATLKPYKDLPASSRSLIDSMPADITSGFKNG